MRVSITTKIVGIIVLISTLFYFSTAYIFIARERSQVKGHYIEKSTSIAYALDAGITSYEDLEDQEGLQSKVYQLLWLDPDLMKIGINVSSNSGLKIVASNDLSLLNTLASADNQVSFEEDRIISKFIELSEVPVLVTIVPFHVSGQRVGTFELNYCFSNAEEEILSQAETFFTFSIISVFVTTVVSLLLFRGIIIKPIRDLSRAMKIIGSGNLDYARKIKSTRSKDEVGELGESFYKMMGDLKSYKDNVEKNRKELSKKVKELRKKSEELRRFNKIVVGRELKMLKLKEEIGKLKKRIKAYRKK